MKYVGVYSFRFSVTMFVSLCTVCVCVCVCVCVHACVCVCMHACMCVCITTAPRILKFGTNIGYDFCCIVKAESAFSCLSFPLFVHFLFSPINFFIKEFSGTTAPRILKFLINIGYSFLYHVRENQHPHAYYLFICHFFIFLQ